MVHFRVEGLGVGLAFRLKTHFLITTAEGEIPQPFLEHLQLSQYNFMKFSGGRKIRLVFGSMLRV